MNYTTDFIKQVKAAADIIIEAAPYFYEFGKKENLKYYTAICDRCGGKVGFSREKGIYKCFGDGCENKGDVFVLLQEFGKMSFAEALTYLAEKYGVQQDKKNGVSSFGKIEVIKKNNVSFVPNSFQTPNAYVDVLEYFLTSDEFKILMNIVRRIFGYENKRELHHDNISISQIEHGQRSKETGNKISNGVGLTHPTIIKCINNMCRFRIIKKVGRASRLGQLIELNLDSDTFAWDLMESRLLKTKNLQKKKAEKMRKTIEMNKKQIHATG